MEDRHIGYTTTGSNAVRQRFTGYQGDLETGLDFAEARYYKSQHGRFTAVDPLLASGKSANPQTFNRYVYGLNRPLVLNDPTGLQVGSPSTRTESDDKVTKKDFNIVGYTYKQQIVQEAIYSPGSPELGIPSMFVPQVVAETDPVPTSPAVNQILSSFSSGLYGNTVNAGLASDAIKDNGTAEVKSVTFTTGLQTSVDSDNKASLSANAGASITIAVSSDTAVQVNKDYANGVLMNNARVELSKVLTPTTSSPTVPVKLTETEINGLLAGARRDAETQANKDLDSDRDSKQKGEGQPRENHP